MAIDTARVGTANTHRTTKHLHTMTVITSVAQDSLRMYALLTLSNFAHEILGTMLDLEPHRWRRPKRVAGSSQRVEAFRVAWEPFDWTRAL